MAKSESDGSACRGKGRLLAGLTVAALVAVCAGRATPGHAATVNFTAAIDAAQETTCAMSSTAQGAATVTLDDVSGMLSWNITFGNNSPMFNNGTLDFGVEFAAHFHGPAPAGMTAAVKVPLPTGSPKVGSTTITSAPDRTDIKNELWYINIHSNPGCIGGEIRGQVLRVPTCSDGIIDGGEQCDDGNLANGDCCDSTCQNEPDGQACNDGNGTTINDQCSSGVCSGTPSGGIDHYLCWQYKGDAKVVDVAGAVAITDQFGTHNVDKAKKAKFMCNPAVKTGNLGDLINPNDHLVCYGMKPVKFTVPNVTTSDQFLNQLLEAKHKAKLLCVPANKS